MTELSLAADPLLHMLDVTWVEYHLVQPNTYNPNLMEPVERDLLKQSLLEDGWTQPLIVLPATQTRRVNGADLQVHVIVDGEQRWTVAGMPVTPAEVQAIIDDMEARKQAGTVVSESILARLHDSLDRISQAVEVHGTATLASITGGLVPITILDIGDVAHQRISTIRHNRARGVHSIGAMAAITRRLVEMGLDTEDLGQRLGMSAEEVFTYMQEQQGQIEALAYLAQEPFSAAWEPVHLSELSEEELARRGLQVTDGFVDASMGEDGYVRPRKLAMRFFPNELAVVLGVVGEEDPANGLVRFCQVIEAHEAEFRKWVGEML